MEVDDQNTFLVLLFVVKIAEVLWVVRFCKEGWFVCGFKPDRPITRGDVSICVLS
jgi:hypothetical protein